MVRITLIVLVATAVAPAQTPTAEELASRLGFDAGSVEAAKQGRVAVRDQAASTKKELATAAMVLVHAPLKNVTERLRGGAALRADPDATVVDLPDTGVQVGDFAQIGLSERDMPEVRAFLHAKPGDALNLSREEAAAFGDLRARVKGPEDQQDALAARLVSDQLRLVLAERVNAYRRNGLRGLGIYARDKGEDTDPGRELQAAANAERLLGPEFNELRRVALEDGPPPAGSRWFVVRSEVELRPEFELVRIMPGETQGASALVQRHFHVSHSYNTTEITVVCVSVGNDTLIFHSNRTSTDGLVGVGGDARRTIAQTRLREEVSRSLRRLREQIEAKPAAAPEK